MDSSSDDDNYEDLFEILEDRLPIRPSVKIKPQNPLDIYNEAETFARYRFCKQSIHDLMDLILPRLRNSFSNSTNISPLAQLLVTLRFYASGMCRVSQKSKQIESLISRE